MKYNKRFICIIVLAVFAGVSLTHAASSDTIFLDGDGFDLSAGATATWGGGADISYTTAFGGQKLEMWTGDIVDIGPVADINTVNTFTNNGFGPGTMTVTPFNGYTFRSTETVECVIKITSVTVTKIDFEYRYDYMAGGATGSISGLVNYEAGASTNVCVVCWDDPSRTGLPDVTVKGLKTGTTWTYQLSDLPAPTTYYVTSFLDLNGNNVRDGGEMMVDYPGGIEVLAYANVPNINMGLIEPSTGTIAGLVNYEGAVSTIVYVMCWDTSTRVGSPDMKVEGLKTGTTWTYELDGLPAPTTYYVTAFLDEDGDGMWGGGEMRVDYSGGIEVLVAGYVPNINMELIEPSTGSISGLVNYEGGASTNVCVLCWDNPSRFGLPEQKVKGLKNGTTWTYLLDDLLAPATYYVSAFLDENHNNFLNGGEDKVDHPTPVEVLAYTNVPNIDMEIIGTASDSPNINNFNPSGVNKGDSWIRVHIYGWDFQSNAQITCVGAASTTVTIENYYYNHSGYMEMDMTVSTNAAVGPATIRVTNPTPGLYDEHDLSVYSGGGGGGAPSTIDADAQPWNPAINSTTTLKAWIKDDAWNTVTNATNLVVFERTSGGGNFSGFAQSVSSRSVNAVNGVATVEYVVPSSTGDVDFSVNSSGLTGDYIDLEVGASSNFGTIMGQISYNGSYVGSTATKKVLVFDNIQFSTPAVASVQLSGSPPWGYQINNAPIYNDLYVLAYIDANYNGKVDKSDDPAGVFTVFQSTQPENIYLSYPGAVKDYTDIFMGDPGVGMSSMTINYVSPDQFMQGAGTVTVHVYGSNFWTNPSSTTFTFHPAIQVTTKTVHDPTYIELVLNVTQSVMVGWHDMVLEDNSGDFMEIVRNNAVQIISGGGANEPSNLACYASPQSMPADGVSESNIIVEIQDPNNNLVTSATNTVTFSLTGQATLVGNNPVSAISGTASIAVKAGVVGGVSLQVQVESPGLSDGITNITLYSTTTGSNFATVSGEVEYHGQYEQAGGDIYVILANTVPISSFINVTSDTGTVRAYAKAAGDNTYSMPDAPAGETLYLMAFKDLNGSKKYEITGTTEPFGFLPYPNDWANPEPLVFSSGDYRYFNMMIHDPGADDFNASIEGIEPSFKMLPTLDTTYYFTITGNGFTNVDSVKLKAPAGELDVTSTVYIDTWTLSISILLTTGDANGNYNIIILDDTSQDKAFAPGMLYISDTTNQGAGVATQIECWSESYNIASDTKTTVVHAEIQDAGYQRVTNATNKITFSASGSADIVSANPVWASYGEAQVTIRSKNSTGTVRITASAQDLISGTVDVNIFNPGSGSQYGTIDGNVFYQGNEDLNVVNLYVKPVLASAYSDTWHELENIASTTALAGITAGVKNELALEALRRKIDNNLGGADVNVVDELITEFPYGGWLGSDVVDSYGHYKIIDAPADTDLLVFAFVDSNNNADFSEDIIVSTNTEPFGFYKFHGTVEDYPAIVWLDPDDTRYNVDIDAKDPAAATGAEINMTIYGIDPPSSEQALPGQAAGTEKVYAYGKGFVDGCILSFYPADPPIIVTTTTFIDKYSIEASIQISSNVYAREYDVVVTTGNSSAKAYGIFHVNSSQGANTLEGEITYGGQDGSTGTVCAVLFRDNDRDPFKTQFSVSNSTDCLSYSFTGIPDGMYSVFSFMDMNDSGEPNPDEPKGMYSGNPVYLYGGITSHGNDIQLYKMEFDKAFISGVDPYSVMRGTTGAEIIIFGGQLEDTIDVSFGPGVTVTTFTAEEYEIELEIDISTSAYLGDKTVVVTSSGGYMTSEIGIFKVIDSGTSGSGEIKGSVYYVDSGGEGSGINSGEIVVSIWAGGLFQGPPLEETYETYTATAPSTINYSITGLAADDYSVMSYLDINHDRKPDMNEPMTVYQFNPVGVSDGLTTRVNLTLYDINTSTSINQVYVDYVMPMYVAAGSTETVYIYADGIMNGTGTEIMFGQGVSISTHTVFYDSATIAGIKADIDVSASANEGFRDITITNADGSYGVGMNMIVVMPAAGAQDLAAGDGSISGTLYNNSGSTGTYMIAVWDGYIFSGPPIRMEQLPAPQGVNATTYTITGLADSSSYYLGVYIDKNSNYMPDHIPGVLEEPEEVYGGFDSPRNIVVNGGMQIQNINITFDVPRTIELKEFMPEVLVAGVNNLDIFAYGYGFSNNISTSHINISTTSITLNSVEFLDFSQLRLNVDVSAGASGSCSISITNPADSSISTGAVTIVADETTFTSQTGDKAFTVRVLDYSGDPISKALVVAVSFDQANFEPKAEISRAGYTGSDGRCKLFLEEGEYYMIAADKHMYEPSLKVQMMDPLNTPVRPSAGSKTVKLRERPGPGQAASYELVGSIKGKIDNVRLSEEPRVLLMEVFSRKYYEPVNFAMIPAAAKTIYYTIGNIPVTDNTDEYELNVFDPVFGIGTSSDVAVAITTDTVVEVNLNFQASEDLSNTADKEGETTDVVSFTGYIYEDLNGNDSYDIGEGIEDAKVVFRSYAYEEGNPNAGIEEQIEVMTNANGKYVIYNAPLYQTSDSSASYYTEGNYVGPKGGLPNNNTYSIEVYADGYSGICDYYGSNTGKYSDYERTYQGGKLKISYSLTQAAGSINGYVYLGSTSVPVSAHVNVWPDGNMYGNIPPDPGLSKAYTWTSSTGYFELNGLGNGNYSLYVHSDFSQYGYDYNLGENQSYDDDDSKNMDDLRITVSNGSYSVYQASSGVKVADRNNPITVILKKQQISGMTVNCNINGSVILAESGMDLTGTMVVAKEDWDTIPDTDTDIWGNKRSPRVGFADLSEMTGTNIDYNIKVPTGSYYVELNSPNYGVLGKPSYEVVFESTGSARNNVSFKIASSGKIKGVVRKPDGSLYKPDWEQGEYANVRALGMSVKCWAEGEIKESGEYTISGLLPGVYTIEMDAPETLSVARIIIENVKVTAGQTTALSINFESAEELAIQVPAVSTAILSAIQEPGTGPLSSNLCILAVESGGEQTDAIKEIIGIETGKNIVESLYGNWDLMKEGTTYWSWDPVMVKPELTYDVYLAYFGWLNEETDLNDLYFCNETLFGTILDSEKAVEVSTIAITLDYSKGAYQIGGKVGGKKIITQEDIAKLATDFGYIDELMPRVTILDSDGNIVAGGAGVPVLTLDNGKYVGLGKLKKWIEEGDHDAISNFFDNPANSQYKIKGLTKGKYSVVLKSKNYPPVRKSVKIPDKQIVNFDLDADVAASGGVKGIVKLGTTTVSGATVTLYVGTEEYAVTTDASGRYIIKGISPGRYMIRATVSGCGHKEDKVIIKSKKNSSKNFNFDDVPRISISGTVYKQKMPYPKTIEGAAVILFNETEQAATKSKIATKYESATDENGQYSFTELVTGDVFKIYVIAEGYRLVTKSTTSASDTTVDIVLQSDDPNVSIYQWREPNGDLQIQIESIKALVTKPVVVLKQGAKTLDISQFIQEGAEKIYKLTVYKNANADLDIQDIKDSGFNIKKKINIKATIADVSKESVATAVMNLGYKSQVQFILTDLIVGGDVDLDRSGGDKTKLTFYPGSFVVSGDTITPVVSIDKQDSDDDDDIDDEEDDLMASDVYILSLIEATLKKGNPITFTFDYDESKDTDTITVCFYDPESGKWFALDAVITKDPVTGTLSIDFTTDDLVTESGASLMSYVPYKKKIGYSMSKAVKPKKKIQTILSGIGTKFAVFTQEPSYISEEEQGKESNAEYDGDEFRIYNFPNPFDLSDKQVTLANTGTNSKLEGEKTISGTVFKYYLPKKYDSGSGVDIKFYIYNVAGEMVRFINDEPVRDGGFIYFTEWDGKNGDGEKCASGIYLLMPYINDEFIMEKALKMAIVK
ncbi:carboxypeptidase regulatory-like domain-containing protein [Elusimicrobiota bacterium]